MRRPTFGKSGRWLAILALGMGVGSAACADPKVSLANGPREYTDSDYAQVLERWTRNRNLFALSELDTLLHVTATYESWDFRWAYVVKYASDYRLTVEQRRALLDKTLAETRDSHRFYVALYGTKVRWADLTRANSAWIVRLVDDEGDETAPLSLELIERPGALEQRYFPYTTVFRNVFRIRFPTTTPDGRPTIASHSKWFGLRFAGADGHEELRWEIDEDGDKELAFGPSRATTKTAFGGGAFGGALHAGEHFEERRTRHEQLLSELTVSE